MIGVGYWIIFYLHFIHIEDFYNILYVSKHNNDVVIICLRVNFYIKLHIVCKSFGFSFEFMFRLGYLLT